MSTRTFTIVVLVFTFLASACTCGLSESDVNSTADAAVAEALAALPSTDTPHPSATPVIVTAMQTVIIEVTQVVDRPVTVTPTSTPENTLTPSNTPTITPTPTNTATPTPTPTPTATPNLAQTATVEAYGALAAPKRDGFYVVGTDILPGKWHSTGTGTDCYWARRDSDGELIDNHFGLAGGTVNVRNTDYEIEFNGCGVWEYVENAERVLQADAADPKGDGFYTVGVEIVPGKWRSTGTGDDCYWARLNGNQDILDNHFGLAGGTVGIRATDYEVEFNGCGIWEYQEP